MSEHGPKYRESFNANDRLEWWLDKREQYPFHALAPVSIKPHLVDAAIEPSASVVLSTGWRTWGFTSAENRDRFCAQFGGRPC